MLEAARSVAEQNYVKWEVVVIDDGSQPPVDEAALRAVLGDRLKLVRHERPSGIPVAKNAGIRAAAGEVIFHLDDDDLLTPGALSSVACAYRRYPDLDCVYLNVEPFGPFAPGSAENQSRALARLLERVAVTEENGLLFLGEGLFEALLLSVPLALQRPAARRGTWNIVGGYSDELLFSESEWAIRASLCCRAALLREPVSRWRCEGQNVYSRPEFRQRGTENAVRAARILNQRLRRGLSQQKANLRKSRQHMSEVHFNQAYERLHSGEPGVWGALLRSFVLAPAWKQLRLAAKTGTKAIKGLS
jgi:glycosyltransferase involved in cell wall biosynthesis